MGKILAGLLLIVMTFSAVGCGEMEEDHRAQAKYRRITADEAQVMMAKTENYLILDVRTPEEFAEGHIPHAINIPMDQIGEDPPRQLPDRNQMIFVYCVRGIRSMNVANRLAHMGDRNIVEMGGIQDWHGEIEK